LTKECEGKANNIRSDQSRASCTQLCKNMLRHRHNNKKGLKCLASHGYYDKI